MSDSTTVKFFVKKSVFDAELSDKIKKGKYLRVQGEVQFDKYTKEIDIMAKNIMAAAAPAPRMDDAEEKRVELASAYTDEQYGWCDTCEKIY